MFEQRFLRAYQRQVHQCRVLNVVFLFSSAVDSSSRYGTAVLVAVREAVQHVENTRNRD